MALSSLKERASRRFYIRLRTDADRLPTASISHRNRVAGGKAQERGLCVKDTNLSAEELASRRRKMFSGWGFSKEGSCQ
jgi:hypothetical protein